MQARRLKDIRIWLTKEEGEGDEDGDEVLRFLSKLGNRKWLSLESVQLLGKLKGDYL